MEDTIAMVTSIFIVLDVFLIEATFILGRVFYDIENTAGE